MLHMLVVRNTQVVQGWIKANMPTNTTKAYGRYAAQYMDYCGERGLAPEKSVSVCLFMKHALEVRKLSRSTIVGVIPSAINDKFRFDDVKPASGELVRQTKITVGRLTKPSKAKLPVTKTQLEALVKVMPPTEKGIRNMFMMILMFLGFLRESEAAALKQTDLYIGELEGYNGDVLFIRIGQSKTDQTHETATIVLCGSKGSTICPIKWFKWHCAVRHESPFVFTDLYRGVVKGLSAKTPCGIVKRALASIGIDPKPYGSHSLRRGGATAAAKQKIRMHVLKRHGRWRSDAVYLYITDSAEERLLVAASILES